MKKILIIALALLMTSCITLDREEKPDRSPGEKVPHVGGPMTTFVGGVELQAILDSFGKNSNVKELQAAFLESSGLRQNDLTGQARLIFQDLDAIVRESQNGVVPEKPPADTHKECIEAYSQKRQWHIENNGAVPATFGKITEYALSRVPRSRYWVGAIDLCTWIGDVNYYFNISFLNSGRDSLELNRPPFSDLISTLTEEDTADFNYKLHAKGNGSVVYKNVFRNGVFYASADPIYAELEKDCFDTFYVSKPTGVKAIDLADQTGYCMGRCDGRVLNTGK